jgi:hypothetical protein
VNVEITKHNIMKTYRFMLNCAMYLYFLQISATKAASSILFVHFQINC